MFKEKVVIVTGAASGIGLATARLFVEEGASVVIVDRNAAAAQAAAHEAGGQTLAIAADVGLAQDVQAMVAQVVAKFGRIDVLVNNAGFGFKGTVESIAEEDWDRLFAANVKGVFLCSKHVIPVMAKQGGGAIVNTGSYTASVGIADRAAYVASKGAVVSLSRAMALDHIHQNIRVNCVAPGTIASPYFEKMFAESSDPDGMRAELDGRAPLGRMGKPEEIAQAIVWLASERAAFAVGSTLTVDGGTTIW